MKDALNTVVLELVAHITAQREIADGYYSRAKKDGRELTTHDRIIISQYSDEISATVKAKNKIQEICGQ